MDDRPWDRPYGVRRDWEPYRGGLLSALGTISALCSVLAWCLFVPGFVGIPLGVAVWIMARDDLRKMDSNRMEMDPARWEQVANARTKGLVAVVLGLLSGGWWLFRLYIYLTVGNR